MLINKKLMTKRIYNNQEVYYGLGASSCLKSLEYTEILLLVSPSIKKSENYKKFSSYLAGKNVREEITISPSENSILELREKYLDSGIHVIIALGGGKILDSAKVLKTFIDNPTLSFNDLAKTEFAEKNIIKLISIPTTPGTGSETNSIAVIRNSEGKKIPYINQAFVPNLAILDHKFMTTLSEESIFEFSADIFSHGFEGSVSKISSPLLQAIGNSSLNLLKNGHKAIKMKPGDKKGLADILYAGHLGGIVQGNAYVGVCHALAHALEERAPISHGGSILLLLKPVIQWLQKTQDRPEYDELLSIYDEIGFDQYRKPEVLQNINPGEWTVAALQDPSVKTNPIRMKQENMLELVNWILSKK